MEGESRMVQRSIILFLLVLVGLTGCKESSRDEVEMVRIPMISGYTEVGDPVYQVFYMDTDRSYCGAIQEVFKVFWL